MSQRIYARVDDNEVYFANGSKAFEVRARKRTEYFIMGIDLLQNLLQRVKYYPVDVTSSSCAYYYEFMKNNNRFNERNF